MDRADVEAQIDAARHDPDVLYVLCEQLAGQSEAWAGPLRFRARHLRVKARRGEPEASALGPQRLGTPESTRLTG